VVSGNGTVWTVIGGTGGVTDGDKGDITVSGGGVTWTIDAGAVTSTALADNAVTSAKILDGTIVNADINASAAIAPTKLAFTQTGTGASARTVDAKLKDGWVSVTDFGADTTGASDATTAINNAIAAVNTAGGGVVYFPPGTYATTSGITLGNGTADAVSTKDNRIRLVGASYGSGTGIINQQVNGSSRILFTGTASTTAAVMTLAGPMYGVGIENLTLDCDNKAGYALLCNHVTQATFHRVTSRNYTNVGYFLTTRSKNPTGCAFGNADNRFTDCYGFLDAFSTNNIRAIVLHTGANNEAVTFSNSGGHILGTYATDMENLAEVEFYTTGSLPSGLSTGTSYWVIRQSATTAKYATSLANAKAGTPISYSTAGSGTHGYAKQLNGQPDSARNIFIGGTYFYNNTASSHGAWLMGADNNAFIEVQFLPAGQSEAVTFSNSGGHILGTHTTDYADLSEVRFDTTGTLPAGLALNTSYWTKRQSATTAKFATSLANANAGTFISYSTAGSGTHTYAILAQGYDVYLQQWSVGGGLFPLENYFSNLGMSRGVGGNGNIGSGFGNLFIPFPTSDTGGGGGGLDVVSGTSGITHTGKTYIAGQRAYRGRQIIRIDDSTTRTTSSTTEVDLTGYSTTITTLADTKLKVTLSVWATKFTTGYGYFYINVGGTDDAVSELRVGADGYYSSRVTVAVIDVAAATHTVKVRFKSSSAGNNVEVLKGFMIVEELY